MSLLVAAACVAVCAEAGSYTPQNAVVSLSLKVPGNAAKLYPLTMQLVPGSEAEYQCVPVQKLPVQVTQKVEEGDGAYRITVLITASENVYFKYNQQIKTGFTHDSCQFYMPGFWYRRNLRSPQQAPSFHTADSWTVSEDRLSVPMTGIYDESTGRCMTVVRLDKLDKAALTTHKEGEVIVSGTTSLGFTGFRNMAGEATLDFGFPYQETPKSYIRKLTLTPSVQAFQQLNKGEQMTLTWEVRKDQASGFSDFIRQSWEYSYDTFRPVPVPVSHSTAQMKEVLSNFFTASYVSDKPLKYMSGVELVIDDCLPQSIAELGFTSRVLLNAFNALEYAGETNRKNLADQSYAIYASYLENGFTKAGFFREVVNFSKPVEDPVHSIRRQSETMYAVFRFLQYEKDHGRKHPEWEARLKGMLDMCIQLQNEDGSFPRKFRDDFSLVDASGGSTASAILPLVMGYKYFNDKRYLKCAERTGVYLEKEIVSKADYFSSTLDANCEDKEASLYASTAFYYLSLVTKGAQSRQYAALCREASYFALSWYYMWDVPFATGQMLGDIGLKTRGWGNVSVENNHIDVFVFEFASVLNWLSVYYSDPRFSSFAEVIHTSMRQLLPREGFLCGIAKPGFYPEVVQHTNWDYGRNGKGFYNLHFAPGWTVASLWELLTPGRAEAFLTGR